MPRRRSKEAPGAPVFVTGGLASSWSLECPTQSSPLFNGTITVFDQSAADLPRGLTGLIVVRGVFTRDVPCEHVLTGQSFARPIRVPGRRLFTSLGLALLRAWSPKLTIQHAGSTPFMLTPLLAAASRVKLEVQPTPVQSTASTSAVPPADDAIASLAAQRPTDADRVGSGHASRRKYFATCKAASSGSDLGSGGSGVGLEAHRFESGVECTFYFIVARVQLGTLRLIGLPYPFNNVRLDSYLDGQPLRLMGVHCATAPPSMTAADALWDIELWSERGWQRHHGARTNSDDPVLVGAEQRSSSLSESSFARDHEGSLRESSI